jgi:hypothetical protein
MKEFNDDKQNDDFLKVLLGKYASDEDRGNAVLKYLQSGREENFPDDKNPISDDRLIDLDNLSPQEMFL